MFAEFGLFCLILALLVSAAQATLPFWGAAKSDAALMRFADHAAVATFALTMLAFLALTMCFVLSDFSVTLVTSHSEVAKPLLYKISGVWANHEGSMLLWVLILTLFSAAIAFFGDNLPASLKARVLGTQGLVALGFLAFLIFTSNPFERLANPPLDGNGINPILQDPGLAIHPPFLYLGYVGFSVAYSFAVAALLEGEVDAAWARWVRPWVLAAWSFLTIGIALGSFWAYYILGWGGWWFWDPVENVSFMPWLAGTALLHSAIVVERRHALVNWTLLLAILTFSLSLVGTFVVRSGVLTSVHAFANDPERGFFILMLLGIATGGALLLYAIKISDVRFGSPFAPISREGALVANNVLLMAATATVLLGTFYPLVIDMLGSDKISVGPPYYNKTFLPIMCGLLIIMAIGPTLKWKRDDANDAKSLLQPAFWVSLAAATFVLFTSQGTRLLTAGGMALAAWLCMGTLMVLAKHIRLFKTPLSNSAQLFQSAPRAFHGLILGHLGLGLLVAAITTVSSFERENILAMKPGDKTEIAGYAVSFVSLRDVKRDNYLAQSAIFEVTSNGQLVTTLNPEKRLYTRQQRVVSHTSIHTNLISNIYIALGDQADDGKFTVRLYYHPLAPWLWLGALMMAAGGFLALSDRRFRSAKRLIASAPQAAE